MIKKIPPLIVFRNHVDDLITKGALKCPEDPVIYSIKERASLEVSHRLNHFSMKILERNHSIPSLSDEIRDHVADIFFRDDYLDRDDYDYLNTILNEKDRLFILTRLVVNKCEGRDLISGHRSPNISKFLSDFPNHTLHETHVYTKEASCSEILKDGKLISLLGAYFPDPAAAASLYMSIESTMTNSARAHRHGLEVQHLKNAARNRDGYPPSVNEIDTWLRLQNILNHIRFENQKEITGPRQMGLIKNQINALCAIDLHDEPAKTNLSDVRASIVEMLNADIEFFLTFMRQAASKSILAFGKPDTKSDGPRVPTNMQDFTELLKKQNLDLPHRQELMGLMVTTLCSVNLKNMGVKDAKAFIASVKDDVDWKSVVDGMNAKGRAALVAIFPEAHYYRAYLQKAERGQLLESEIGL